MSPWVMELKRRNQEWPGQAAMRRFGVANVRKSARPGVLLHPCYPCANCAAVIEWAGRVKWQDGVDDVAGSGEQ